MATSHGQNRSFMKALLPLESIARLDPSEALSASTAIVLLYVMQYPDRALKELEKMTGLSKSSISRHVLTLTPRGDRARSRPGLGLVDTYEDAHDARSKRVKLTPKGDRLAMDILKVMET